MQLSRVCKTSSSPGADFGREERSDVAGRGDPEVSGLPTSCALPRCGRNNKKGICRPVLGPRCCQGLALLEVLVSLLLVGLAAAAWLQAQADAVRQARLSANRALALMLAADMAERLRASPAVAPAMAYSAPFAAQASLASLRCEGTVCDAQGWAAADASQWRQLVRDALPQGSTRVQVDSSSRQARITLAWRDPGALGGAIGGAIGPGSAQPCPAELALGAQDGVLCYTLEVAW